MDSEMNVSMTRNGDELVVSIEGKLNAMNAGTLDEKLQKELPGTQKIIFDLAGLNYISSAGLRILLTVYQEMEERDPQGVMIVKNVNDLVKTVFDMTDLLEVFDIK